jgi:hypothetical protein
VNADSTKTGKRSAFMKVWSRGLGKTELLVDLRYFEARKDANSNNVSIIGNITDPVNWEFRATLEPVDVAGFIKFAFKLCVIELVLKNMYRYIVYFFKRNQYKYKDHANLEERVRTSYDRMMRGRNSPTHLRSTGTDR